MKSKGNEHQDKVQFIESEKNIRMYSGVIEEME